MRAIGVYDFGGPDKLQVLDLPEPHAGPGEIRIRVHAATVNPTDVGLVSGAYAGRFGGRPAPYVPGAEAAGVVSEVGVGAPFAVGDAVLAVVVPASVHGGAYADELVVDASQAVPIPTGLDAVHAATLPMNGLTAVLSLEALAVPAGGTIAVTGAPGAYGGYVVQLAKVAGLRVVVDAQASDEALVRALGADEVVPRGQDLPAAVRAVAPQGVEGLADGAVLNATSLGAIRDGGALATIRGWAGPAERGITVTPVMVYDAANRTDALRSIAALADSGALTLRVAHVLPAEKAAEAHRLLAAGGMRGRLVLDFTS
jgi:NADPH2:quinone reductase